MRAFDGSGPVGAPTKDLAKEVWPVDAAAEDVNYAAGDAGVVRGADCDFGGRNVAFKAPDEIHAGAAHGWCVGVRAVGIARRVVVGGGLRHDCFM